MRGGGGLAAGNGIRVDGIAGLSGNRSSSLKFGGEGLGTGDRCMYGGTRNWCIYRFCRKTQVGC